MKGLEGLPDSPRRSLDDWRKAVKKALGPKLVAIVVHGSAARGEYKERESDIDTVIVVRGASLLELRALRTPVKVGRMAARIEPLVLDMDEMAEAADVFPLLYESIRRHRVVIFGKDPFESIAPSGSNVRLRIEQELRDASVRLRLAAIESADDALRAAVDRKLRQIREPLRALLELKGKPCEDSLDEVVRLACATWNVDVRAVRSVSAERAHGALGDLLERAVEDVRKMAP